MTTKIILFSGDNTKYQLGINLVNLVDNKPQHNFSSAPTTATTPATTTTAIYNNRLNNEKERNKVKTFTPISITKYSPFEYNNSFIKEEILSKIGQEIKKKGLQINNIKLIASGGFHTFFLTNHNELFGTGDNTYHQLGFETLNTTTPHCYSYNIYNNNNNINTTASTTSANNNGGSNVISASSASASSNGNSCITTLTTLVKLNFNMLFGGTITKIACGYFFTYLVINDNLLWSSGINSEGELGRKNNNFCSQLNNCFQPIPFHTFIPKPKDVILSNNNYNNSNSTYSSLLSNSMDKEIVVTHIDCGDNFCVVVLNNKYIYGTGANRCKQLTCFRKDRLDYFQLMSPLNNGQLEEYLKLGIIEFKDLQNLQTFFKEEEVFKLQCGAHMTGILTKKKHLYFCGDCSSFGQSLMPYIERQEYFVKILEKIEIEDFCIPKFSHALIVLTTDNIIYCYGQYRCKVLTQFQLSNYRIQIFGGYRHWFILSDDKLYAGDNECFQLGIPVDYKLRNIPIFVTNIHKNFDVNFICGSAHNFLILDSKYLKIFIERLHCCKHFKDITFNFYNSYHNNKTNKYNKAIMTSLP